MFDIQDYMMDDSINRTTFSNSQLSWYFTLFLPKNEMFRILCHAPTSTLFVEYSARRRRWHVNPCHLDAAAWISPSFKLRTSSFVHTHGLEFDMCVKRQFVWKIFTKQEQCFRNVRVCFIKVSGAKTRTARTKNNSRLVCYQANRDLSIRWAVLYCFLLAVKMWVHT